MSRSDRYKYLGLDGKTPQEITRLLQEVPWLFTDYKNVGRGTFPPPLSRVTPTADKAGPAIGGAIGPDGTLKIDWTLFDDDD